YTFSVSLVSSLFFFSCSSRHRALHSFPTRRSSDLYAFSLTGAGEAEQVSGQFVSSDFLPVLGVKPLLGRTFAPGEDEIGGAQIADRKSTRLNSSHLVISYAVFCLKKKKMTQE